MKAKAKKSELTDSELVSDYIKGNEGAFEILVERHKNRLFTAIFLIVRDRCAAEDIMQDVFIKAVDTIKSGRYNDEGKFLPWLLRVAHNLSIDFFRKQKRYPTIAVENENGKDYLNSEEFAIESPETECIRGESIAELKELIKLLPQAQKEVLMMRHFFKMSFQEIADATGVSINTALGRMRYAVINLRKLMNENAYVNKKTSYQE
jgi:RNA polymerase sigma-70 factor (ECF subfamily)